MNIKRQYSLPNCRIVLEGVDNSNAGETSGSQRPLLSLLIHAECHFTGIETILSGGREFLDSLVRSVSAYAQEFLSGIRHPLELDDTSSRVRLLKGEEPDIHHLIWQPPPEEGATESDLKPLRFDLNTIQLFDLVEAVDQLFADSRTLPDLSLSLTPVSRRYRKADVPATKRVTPMLTGVGTLAIAAVLLFMIPVPEVKEPEVPAEETSSETTDTESSESPEETPSSPPLSPDELEEVLAEAPKITDPTEIAFLQRHIRREIEQAWDNREAIDRDLTYRVSASLDGAIVNYEPEGDVTEAETELTPLPDLRYLPTQDDIAQREPVVDFKFVFTNGGTTTINPWEGQQGTPTLGEQIEDGATLTSLIGELQEKLQQEWQPSSDLNSDLIFRVGVTEMGEIADYEARNAEAYFRQEQTPIPELYNPEAAGIGGENDTVLPQEPLGQFQVVFRSNGAIEVSRW